MVPNKCEVIDCFHQYLHSRQESVVRTALGSWGREQSDRPATASVVLTDIFPGAKLKVALFVLQKTLDKCCFLKMPLFFD